MSDWLPSWKSHPHPHLHADPPQTRLSEPSDADDAGRPPAHAGTDGVDGVDDGTADAIVSDRPLPFAVTGSKGWPPPRARRRPSAGEASDPAPGYPKLSIAGALSADELRRLEVKIRATAADMAGMTREWLHMIGEFDRNSGWSGYGITSCAHWLSWTCSVSPVTAREYVRVARALSGLPLVDAAFAAGRLSLSKVRAITRVADRVDEQVLLDQALVQTASQLERTVRGFRRADGDGLVQQRKRRAGWHWDDDGMLVLSARLPPDEGALLVAALNRATDRLRPPENTSACPDGSDATDAGQADRDAALGEILDVDRWQLTAADILVALAEAALAAEEVDSSGDDRQLVILHADAALLADVGEGEDFGMVGTDFVRTDFADGDGADVDGTVDHAGGDEPGESTEVHRPPIGYSPRRNLSWESQRCMLENGPGVDLATARRIACDAAMVAVLHNVRDGEPLRLGRKTRTISPAQRRALRIRDGGCCFPGCHRRTFLEAHHVQWWSLLGHTDLENLVLVCRAHHMLVHEGGFTVSAASDMPEQGWVFRDPYGVLVVRPIPTQAGLDRPLERPRPDPEADPDRLMPGWRGERFEVAETVGVLCRAPRQESEAA